MASSHAHPLTHRRRWLEGSSTWSLLCLCEAFSTRSLSRLGAQVEDVLHQRWREQPSGARRFAVAAAAAPLRADGEAGHRPPLSGGSGSQQGSSERTSHPEHRKPSCEPSSLTSRGNELPAPTDSSTADRHREPRDSTINTQESSAS